MTPVKASRVNWDAPACCLAPGADTQVYPSMPSTDTLNFRWTSRHGSVNFAHLEVLLAVDVKESEDCPS